MPVAEFDHANRLFSAGRYDEAASAYLALLARAPRHADAWYNLGVARTMQKRLAEAAEAYRRALAHRPDYANAHNNLAILLEAQGAREEARHHFRAAGTREARYNVALTLQQEERLEEAAAAYGELLADYPDHTAARNNLGNVMLSLGHPSAALVEYRRTLAYDRGNAEAHFNCGVAELLLGRLETGFREYEWRFRQPGSCGRGFEPPLWDGSPLDGRRILLHAEQGLGDTIQFIRYAPLVKECGGWVIAEAHTPLLELLAGVRGVDQWVGRGSALPPFDLHAPLMSLPHIFRTGLETIPAAVPYIVVDADRRERWGAVLGRRPGPKVGLSWSGNPEHKNNRNRSLAAGDVERLLVPGIQWFSLQKGVSGPVPGLEDESTTLADTAAILVHLDLLITVDTMLAHLAGALGRPVWTLVPYAPDWRWLREREDSPWYPTMRLFRQDRPKDWSGALARVVRALESVRDDAGTARH